mmetsp:Transcript_8728/g.32247  ORF Transcript_8728/g.32247 Transcript_8728/m.32247 type:complete len:215 (-) Transcript_8728:344-988(-)
MNVINVHWFTISTHRCPMHDQARPSSSRCVSSCWYPRPRCGIFPLHSHSLHQSQSLLQGRLLHQYQVQRPGSQSRHQLVLPKHRQEQHHPPQDPELLLVPQSFDLGHPFRLARWLSQYCQKWSPIASLAPGESPAWWWKCRATLEHSRAGSEFLLHRVIHLCGVLPLVPKGEDFAETHHFAAIVDCYLWLWLLLLLYCQHPSETSRRRHPHDEI